MAAVADEQLLAIWLDGLRVPIALESLGAGGKGWKAIKTGKKPRVNKSR